MRDGPTRQRLSGFMFLMVNGRAQPVARVGLWITRARSRVLVLLGGGFSDAAGRPGRPGATNASGQVVGESDTAGGSRHAFSWTAAGGMIDLGTLGGAYSAATAVNDSGQVVGESDPADGNRHRHAFSWTTAGGMVDLGTLLGGPRSTATAVNDSGQVVGVSVITDDASSFHAFLWTAAGGMVDLGTLGA